MCYPHTHSPLFAQNSTTFLPLSFSSETQKAPIMPALFLSPIHPFRSLRMPNLYPFPTLSRVLSMSFQNLFLSSPSPSLGSYHHIYFNLWRLEFNLENSRAKTPKVYRFTAPHIVQQDGDPFPSSFHLLNTGNDAINSTP